MSQKSQSLRADQGNSDAFNAVVGRAAKIKSQSLRADQGNSDTAKELGLSRVGLSKSQSLRADQGNSDSYFQHVQAVTLQEGRNPSVLIRAIPTVAGTGGHPKSGREVAIPPC